MINIPGGIQTFNYDCGAKALQLVMAYYGVEIREDRLLAELESDSNGTSIENMIRVAESKGFQVIAQRGLSLETIKRYIENGMPVIVLIQAWAERRMTLRDWRHDYDDGHYAIVVGYMDNIVVFEDPSSFRRVWLTEKEFVARWHDADPVSHQKFEQFAMILIGKTPSNVKMEHMD